MALEQAPQRRGEPPGDGDLAHAARRRWPVPGGAWEAPISVHSTFQELFAPSGGLGRGRTPVSPLGEGEHLHRFALLLCQIRYAY